jgi:hypothetical protein
MMRLFRRTGSHSFLASPAFKLAPAANATPLPILPLDGSAPRGYYGNSNGGIQGVVYMALSQDVSRGVIGVGGGPVGAIMLGAVSNYAPVLSIIMHPCYQ